MGGEHVSRARTELSDVGSSPHGRGTLGWPGGGQQHVRVIPAWAGNTSCLCAASSASSGHPRMGGEHHRRDADAVLAVRVIPAWAGNTQGDNPRRCWTSGHPRMGGEHKANPNLGISKSGSSPHGRGTRARNSVRVRASRVIPAWAGNTPPPAARRSRGTGHPRMGGEHDMRKFTSYVSTGSSPHGRGTLVFVACQGAEYRVIPAWAGNTAAVSLGHGCAPGHPRMGGEHRFEIRGFGVLAGSSPHGRGTRTGHRGGRRKRRVIPAWAGNTLMRRICPRRRTGHPRMGGEHYTNRSYAGSESGSSPHGRGTRVVANAKANYLRVIPAWAGNTAPTPWARWTRTGHPRMGGEHRRPVIQA